jgi:cyanophycin synthetase
MRVASRGISIDPTDSGADRKPSRAIQLEQLRFLSGAGGGLDQSALLAGIRLHPAAGSLAGERFLTEFGGLVATAYPALSEAWLAALAEEGELAESLAREPATAAAPVATTLIAVALQTLAGEPVWGAAVRPRDGGRFELSIPCHDRALARQALAVAMRLVSLALARCAGKAVGDELAVLGRRIADLLREHRRRAVLMSTLRFIAAARRRRIPWLRLTETIYQLGYGAHSRRIDGSHTDRTSVLARRIAKHKPTALRLLRGAGIPVPRHGVARSAAECLKLAEQIGYPVVLKPASQDQGLGVVTGLRTAQALTRAYENASKYGPEVLVEQHIQGDDHRILVVGGRMLAAARRIPGGVVGDGTSAISELVDRANADPRRGSGKAMLIRLALDGEALALLHEAGLAPDSKPEAGRFVRLRGIANISSGGTAEDVGGVIHADNRSLAERAARAAGLDIAGVDLLVPDIGRSWRETGGAVIEVNSQPGLRPHWLAEPQRDLNGEIIDWMFAGQSGRIPIVAVTGTNGKSTVAQMVFRILGASGLHAGVTTTQGIWIGEERIGTEDLSGYPGGRLLLTDPSVEAAVIEMPRKGLIRFGFPFDACDVAALLNVEDDHLGRDGVDTLEQMADLKGEVLRRARRAVVVNAEDPLCMGQLRHVRDAKVVLVSRDPAHPEIARHTAQGGAALVLDHRDGEQQLVLREGAAERVLMPSRAIPATRGGAIFVNSANALFATALAYGMGISLEHIRVGLAGFENSFAVNPGRFNFIDGFPFQLMLDFAHNPHGLTVSCDLVRRLPVAGKRIAVILTVGNRHLRHVREASPILHASFDRFVCGCDPVYAAKNPELKGGAPRSIPESLAANLVELGVAEADCAVEPDPALAVLAGLREARPGDLLVVFGGVKDVMPVIQSALPVA